jgi:hypothetical protein
VPRTNDTFAFPGSIGTWGGPASGDPIAVTGWNALRADLESALTQSFRRDGGGTMSGQFKATAGTISAPGQSWAAEPASGWYRNGTADFRFAVSGVDIFRVTNAGPAISISGVWFPFRVKYGQSYHTKTTPQLSISSAATLIDWAGSVEGTDFTFVNATGVGTIARTGTYKFELALAITSVTATSESKLQIRRNGSVVSVTDMATSLVSPGASSAILTISEQIGYSPGDTFDFRVALNSGTIQANDATLFVTRID